MPPDQPELPSLRPTYQGTEAGPYTYRVLPSDRAPLIQFIADALRASGCRILHEPAPNRAPFRFTFEAPDGERMGIVAYAFFANSRVTRNRPLDEQRFQIKYGSDFNSLHEIWQDPYSLYTTLLVGIDPERGIFVGVDPQLHNPTRFSVSVEYKEEDADEIVAKRWHPWERDRAGSDEPIEILIGGTAESFVRYVRFEREAFGEAPGVRHMLAETLLAPPSLSRGLNKLPAVLIPPAPTMHALVEEFQLSEREVLDLIAQTRRLKMAVRGWVAEEHLVRKLRQVEGVSDCVRNDGEGAVDVDLRFKSVPLRVECKNVLRKTEKNGVPRMDFQRTHASKKDPFSRFYAPSDFDVVAACLHAVEQAWNFRFVVPSKLTPHRKCATKLDNLVRIDERWNADAASVLAEAAGRLT